MWGPLARRRRPGNWRSALWLARGPLAASQAGRGGSGVPSPRSASRTWIGRSIRRHLRILCERSSDLVSVPHMAKGLRPEEEWARQMMEGALGVPVVQHDDGSRARMHDLSIVYPDRRAAAVEATAAADAPSIELWNIMNSGDRWQIDIIQGGWWVSLDPLVARARRLGRELPDLLGQLEKMEVRELRPGRTRLTPGPFDARATELGIVSAGQSGTDFPGSVYITLDLPTERSGGFVADTGDALAIWIGDYLHEPETQDVRDKLRNSGADERHAFVYLPGFTTAPFSASDLLMRNGAPLPTIPPRLPAEVTHVWAVSTWASGDGFRWSPEGGWSKFGKVHPDTEGGAAGT